MLPMLALFVINLASTSGLMTKAEPDPDVSRGTEDLNPECRDIEDGGPDWSDDEWHLDDWRKIVSDCRRNRANLTFDTRSQYQGNAQTQFVHVGKCAGSSIDVALKHVFATGALNEIHIEQVSNCHAKRRRKWIVSARDPISRVISSFNWRSPHNGNSSLQQTGIGQDTQEVFFYECFKTVNDFTEALQDASICGRIARRVMAKPIRSEHIGMGFRWYFEKDLECVLAQEVYLVRSETLVDDLRDVCRHLNWQPPEEVHHEKAQYAFQNMTHLSPKGKRLLTDALKGDYEVLRALEKVAKNGKPGTY